MTRAGARINGHMIALCEILGTRDMMFGKRRLLSLGGISRDVKCYEDHVHKSTLQIPWNSSLS